ncbi:pyridoxal-phosphate dependent enzyme [Amycolatopsis sp. A1MSW2902]|uniref:pyridoxal-phosphate dependent enzyme n=1 Tax=Amycolatopsis sp. A1MSW2902 TaxID=687413 RepID=UPI00307D53FF
MPTRRFPNWTALPEPHGSLFRESVPLSRFPRLRAFRAGLGLTRLAEVPGPPGEARVLAKHEYENPTGSDADRVAYALACQAIGASPDEPRFVAAAGPELARALSHLCSLIGVPLRLALAEEVPLGPDGAVVRVDRADPEGGPLAAIALAGEIAEAEPEWILLDAHRDPVCVAMHEFVTGREIIGQLDGLVPAAWVCGAGAGGCLAGVTRALRAAGADPVVTGVTAAELPYGSAAAPRSGLPGWAGLGHGYRQPLVEGELPDLATESVSAGEARAGVREFRAATGREIGPASAANWLVARAVAAKLPPEDVVVTIFPDGPHEVTAVVDIWEKTKGKG